ncbi:MAG: TRAP transporter small permease subunit [Desulfuromonadales bacterium]|nr:TRAP transporter small permease subunit [Desulfuromonadales bacterium]
MIPSQTATSLPILSWMGRILDLLTKITFHIAGAALAGILCLIVKEVFMRYVFNAPSTWAGDANQWFFALATMLALPEITRVNGNVAITILLERLPQGKRVVLARSIAIVSCFACLLAVYISGNEVMRQFSRGILTNWIYPVPKWWVSGAIPLGFFLSSLQFLRLGFQRSSSEEE